MQRSVKTQSETRPLTDLQQKLADLWLESTFAGMNIPQHELAKAAGYGGSSVEALRVIAHKALHAPNVRAYLRTKARERMDSHGIEAVATLARLTTTAQSERVRADVAHKVAVGTGLLGGEQAAMGAAPIALQVVFRQDAGNAWPEAAQVIDATREISGPHSLAEGEGGATPPPGGASRTRPQATGGRKTRAKVSAPPPHTISSSKASGRGSGGKRGGKR